MRTFTKNQDHSNKTPLLAVVRIEEMTFDPQDRDEVNKTLIGLQQIYMNKPLRNDILCILNDQISVSTKKGRMGMDLWSIFVLGTLRLACNWDYDHLFNSYSHHQQIRMMTGLDPFTDLNTTVSRSTLNENMMVFTKTALHKINELIVRFGHQQIVEEPVNELHVRSDSFVLLSNVRYPTDFTLLADATRKIIDISAGQAQARGITGWREYASMKTKLRSEYNKLSRMRWSTSKQEAVKNSHDVVYTTTICRYLKMCKACADKAEKSASSFSLASQVRLQRFINYARLFIDQIKRRVIKGETIPSLEKVYSVFEPYTEWICKGKAGVRQELGVRFIIAEDQYRFILHSQVMHGQQDVDVIESLLEETKAMFPGVTSCSCDKGFHSKKDENGIDNRQRLEALGLKVCLPKKGKRNQEEREREYTDEFRKMRQRHSGVESAINALESHGLDRCPDKGRDHFDRYALLGVLASNIHNIGRLILQSQRLSAAG